MKEKGAITKVTDNGTYIELNHKNRKNYIKTREYSLLASFNIFPRANTNNGKLIILFSTIHLFPDFNFSSKKYPRV